MSEFHGDVSGSRTYLSTYLRKRGITEGRGRRTGKGQRKTSLFPEHFTPFPPAGACCRSLKGRIRVRRLPPRPLAHPLSRRLSHSILRCPLFLCPFSSSLSRAPCTLLSKHSVIPSSLLLRFSENLTLENFRLAKIFVSFSYTLRSR